MSAVFVFVRAVLRRWVALVSGATALTLLAVYERYSRQSVPWPIYAGLLAVCVVWAMYLAWHEQYAAAQRELTPDLVVEVHGAACQAEQERTMVLITMRVINRGADSAVLGYKVELNAPDGIQQAQVMLIKNKTVRIPMPGGYSVNLRREDAINLRTNAPIKRGGFVSGKLPVVVEGRRQHEIVDGRATLKVTVIDYLGRESSQVFTGTGPKETVSIMQGEPINPELETPSFIFGRRPTGGSGKKKGGRR
jgi:hypothetical protein